MLSDPGLHGQKGTLGWPRLCLDLLGALCVFVKPGEEGSWETVVVPPPPSPASRLLSCSCSRDSSIPMLFWPARAQQAPGVLNNPQAVGSEIINSLVTMSGNSAKRMPSSGTGHCKTMVGAPFGVEAEAKQCDGGV